MKTDIQLQQLVMDELKWDPFLSSSEIGVAVTDSIVTLFGSVDSLAKKIAAEKAVKKVAGVKALAEDIKVTSGLNSKKTDTEIAAAIYNALKWNEGVMEEKIKIIVEDGEVKLEGEVEWDYQRLHVTEAIQHITGVRSVINLIRLTPKIKPKDVGEKIKKSFQRSASIDSSNIFISIEGSKVILSGKVRSLAEKDDAMRAAWNAPGVTDVIDKLVIELPESIYEIDL